MIIIDKKNYPLFQPLLYQVKQISHSASLFRAILKYVEKIE
jgi:NADH dehydrogenase FAD-containing subunit